MSTNPVLDVSVATGARRPATLNYYDDSAQLMAANGAGLVALARKTGVDLETRRDLIDLGHIISGGVNEPAPHRPMELAVAAKAQPAVQPTVKPKNTGPKLGLN